MTAAATPGTRLHLKQVLREPAAWAATALALVLLFSWRLKARCIDDHWDGYQYSEYCYSDAQALYSVRSLADLPYVQSFLEYPVVTGMYTWMVANLAGSKAAFVHLNAAGLAIAAIGTLLLLARWQGWNARLLLWAAAPPLAWYAFYNWDLLAIVAATGGLYAFHRNKPAAAGILLAIGACAKIYPGLFLPIVGMVLIRRENGLGRDGWLFGIAAVATLLALNLPFALANFDLWWQTYTFHLDRTPNFESIWYILGDVARRWDLPWLDAFATGSGAKRLGTVLLLGSVGGAAWMAYTRRMDWLPASFGVLLVFMMTNTFFSLQYALWVVPFLVLLPVPNKRIAAIFAADAFAHFAMYRYFAGTGYDAFSMVIVAVLLRFVAMASLLAWVWSTRRSDAESEPDVAAPDAA